MEKALAIFIVFTLPIERVLTLDVGGYTVRPVYLGMALFLLLMGRYILGAPRGPLMTGAITVVAVALSLFRAPQEAWLTSALYALWAGFNVAFFLALQGYLKNKGDLNRWVELYIGSAAFWGTLALVQGLAALRWPWVAYSFLGPWPRVHALTMEPSYFAVYLLHPLFLALARRSVFAWPIALALSLSTARTGAVGFLGGLMAFVLLSKVRSLLKVQAPIIVVTFCLMALTSLSTLLGAFAVSRTRPTGDSISFAPRVEVRDTSSVAPRLASWNEAWKIWRAHPWGVGVGAYGYAVSGVDDPRAHKTTNLFLEVLAENGPLGLLALLLWALWPMGALFRKRHDELASANLAALVGGVLMFAFFQTWWRPYLWFAWGVAYAYSEAGDRGYPMDRAPRHWPVRRGGARSGSSPPVATWASPTPSIGAHPY